MRMYKMKNVCIVMQYTLLFIKEILLLFSKDVLKW